MNIVLFDTLQAQEALKPFSFTRALSSIRLGIVTIQEKWQYYFQGDFSFITSPYLNSKFPCVKAKTNLCINSTVCPEEMLVEAIKQLQPNEKLVKGNELIACCGDEKLLKAFQNNDFDHLGLKKVSFEDPITQLKDKWDIFLLNNQELRRDFQRICRGRKTQGIHDRHTIAYNEKAIFVEEGATIKAAFFNAELGPIYIGKHAIIQEGAIIQGPTAICNHAQISIGAKIRNATTIGPHARVGGEVSNAVIFGYTNKVHDGFLGNSVLGEWCNLGAGTNTSNLRNDYGEVKVWDYQQKGLIDTKLQFCGLFMGDHSKCAINTRFNTGTVVGVSANVFGANFPEQFVPSFTWGDKLYGTTYSIARALKTAARMMQRRTVQLTEADAYMLTHIWHATAHYRAQGEQ